MTTLYKLRTRTIFKKQVSKIDTKKTFVKSDFDSIRYNQINNLISFLKIYNNSSQNVKDKAKLFFVILKETIDILQKNEIGKCRKENIRKIISSKTIELINNPEIYNDSYYFGKLHYYLFQIVPEESIREMSYTK